MGFSYWTIVLFACVPPIFLLFLVLLCPQRFRIYAIRLTQKFIFTDMGRALPCPLIKLVLFVLLCSFVGLCPGVFKHNSSEEHHRPSPGLDQWMFNAKGWREQRNLYLISTCLVLWWMLYSVHSLNQQLHVAEVAIKQLTVEKSNSRDNDIQKPVPTPTAPPATSPDAKSDSTPDPKKSQ